MAGFEEKLLKSVEKKQIIWWRYVDDTYIYYLGECSHKKICEILPLHSAIRVYSKI